MEYLLAFVAALPVWLAIALKVGVLVGLFGSLLEEIGKRFGLLRLVAVGQQIEAIAVDVPKFVEKIRGWDLPGLAAKFRKTPTVLLMCLALAGVAPQAGCMQVKPALTSVPQSIAVGFKAAGAALAIADLVTASYMDTFESPTRAEVDAAEAVVVKLSTIKVTLDSIRADSSNARDALRGVLADLRVACDMLTRAGAKVPSSIARALDEAEGVLK